MIILIIENNKMLKVNLCHEGTDERNCQAFCNDANDDLLFKSCN